MNNRLFVTLFSMVGYLFSEMGKGSTNNVGLLVWLVVWGVGLVLQFKLKNNAIELIITLISVFIPNQSNLNDMSR